MKLWYNNLDVKHNNGNEHRKINIRFNCTLRLLFCMKTLQI